MCVCRGLSFFVINFFEYQDKHFRNQILVCIVKSSFEHPFIYLPRITHNESPVGKVVRSYQAVLPFKIVLSKFKNLPVN